MRSINCKYMRLSISLPVSTHTPLCHAVWMYRELFGIGEEAEEEMHTSLNPRPHEKELNSFFDTYNEKFRSKSLLEKFTEQEEKRKKEAGEDGKKGGPVAFSWDRERDLLGNKGSGEDQLKQFKIKNANLSSRFAKAAKRD
jgi:hypothetical protein